MTPQEVQERLKLNQLKDKIWYVVPSCATTGEGIFEGLVSFKAQSEPQYQAHHYNRAGYPTTSRPSRSDRPNEPTVFSDLSVL